MQKVIKPWLAFCLALGVFASCSEDRNEPSSTIEGGERVSLGLYVEVSVDDSEARAINYKLGKNANGKIVPMPQFEDKQEVEVHTIIKSNKGAYGVKTLKWYYDEKKKKLILTPTDTKDSTKDLNDIVIDNFTNDDDTKWYISGLLGGTLIDGTTRVSFSGERVLRGVDGNEGDFVGGLNVPYAFGWTELQIDTKSLDANTGRYKYAQVPSSAGVKFSPQGSLIAYKLGNELRSGTHTFSPTGFTVWTNTWGDQGEFELSTDIPSTPGEQSLPSWTESACGSSMYYTFAEGHTPRTIAHHGTADKTYYAWVISNKVQPSSAEVRVMLKGESSRPASDTYRDYTKTYFTDYAPKTTGTQGKVSNGRVHQLTARATQRVALPIEYVTEYNLAGGKKYAIQYEESQGLFIVDTIPGINGDLRFAPSHGDKESGVYDWQHIVGSHYRERDNFLQEIEKTFGAGQYFIPTIEQWWGVYPSFRILGRKAGGELNKLEHMAVGSGSDIFRQSYLSDYSWSTHVGSVVYAIRFMGRSHADCSPSRDDWDYDVASKTKKITVYPSAFDDAMKCAYRIRKSPEAISIDVVYLGEEDSPTALSTIEDEAWWSKKEAEKLVFTRTFPVSTHDFTIHHDYLQLLNIWEFMSYSSSSRTERSIWYVGGIEDEYNPRQSYQDIFVSGREIRGTGHVRLFKSQLP